jgi:hypothetical protein
MERPRGRSVAELGFDEKGERIYEETGSPSIASQVGDIVTHLAKYRFSQIGSIYYTDDVDQELASRTLFAHDGSGSTEQLWDFDVDVASRFRIGPIVDRQFWAGERALMDIDRGPCGCLVCHFLKRALIRRVRRERSGSIHDFHR